MTARVKTRARRMPDVSTVPAPELAQTVRRVRRNLRRSEEHKDQLAKILLNMAPVSTLVDVMRSTEVPEVLRQAYRSMTFEHRILIVGMALHFGKRRTTGAAR